jgi:hypothetical protein
MALFCAILGSLRSRFLLRVTCRIATLYASRYKLRVYPNRPKSPFLRLGSSVGIPEGAGLK